MAVARQARQRSRVVLDLPHRRLQTAADGVGGHALTLLESPQPPIEAVLATLLNELSALPDEVVLVLDDYHVIDAREVQDGMAFLLEHLPAQLHLVIAGRADPPLPLARLRGRGEFVELRAADLRFTPEEAAGYLNQVMGLALTAADVAALEERTEGWIAALQLAALSLQGRDDVAGFIADFAGDDRYIVDYLAEEVLQRQPEPVQQFLLRTSVLDRLCGPLCDAVTGRDDGRAMLAALERGNLFLVPLDDRRRWYRYHQLFADVLRARLLDEQPDHVPDLNRRASAWYERDGQPSEAIGHALAAGDVERAAELVELAIPAFRKRRQEATIRGWLKAIPSDVIRVRPVLAVGFIGALMASGEFEGVEDRLRDTERWLEPTGAGGDATWAPPAGMVVVDQAEFARLPGVIGMYRAALALVRGDGPATIGHAQRAIDRAEEEDHLTRAGASALSGLARWGGGDLEAAHQAYSVAAEGLRRAGYIADVLGCSITLADIRITQGRLGEALRTYEQALRLAADQDGPVLRGTADMYVGISQIARERNDLPAATQHLLRAQELGEHTWLPQNPTAGGSRWRGSGKPRETWTAPSTCWRRRWVCTRATSPRTCGRSRRCGPACWPPRVVSAKPSPGRASRACRLGTTCPTCTSSSTSPWPGCSWPGTGTSSRRAPSTRRPGSWNASCEQRRRGSGRAASSRSWCCRRPPTRREVTSRARWRRWSVP